MDGPDTTNARHPGDRTDWIGWANAGVVVTILAAAGVALTTYLRTDYTACRIATDFLMDDVKDAAIVDAATGPRLRSLYVRMAERHCVEE